MPPELKSPPRPRRGKALPVPATLVSEATVENPGLDESLVGLLPIHLDTIDDHQTAIPRFARDPKMSSLIESKLKEIPTEHTMYRWDSRDLSFLADGSVHLVVTSPPYWTLKEYRTREGQLGHVTEYEAFLAELDKVWAHCYRTLVPGGRLVCVVGDGLPLRQGTGEVLRHEAGGTGLPG